MKKYFIIILTTYLTVSCIDVLDISPLDEITEETYWKTPADLEFYVNQFYPEFGSHLEYYSMDNESDNLLPNTPSEVLHGTRPVPGSGGGWNWENVRKINYFIENAFRVTEGDQFELDQYKGEGYFFRAYFYFNLVKRFGDVPYYSNVLSIDSEGLTAPRDSRNVVIDQIIEDLDKAIELLHWRKELPANRLNKGSALLFKSRVCLYEGTWEKYHAGTVFGVQDSDGRNYLTLAAESANKLIESGNYEIYTENNDANDYWRLFNRIDFSENTEVLLWNESNPELELGTGVWVYLNGNQGFRTGMTKQLIDSYLDINGQPIGISQLYEGDSTLTAVVKNRDPRLEASMWVPGQIQIDYGSTQEIFDNPSLNQGSFGLSTTGYMIRKGSTPDPEQNSGTSSDRNGKTNGIIFRYAEALLNYAEAKAELGELTQDDLNKTINILRQRVGMPDLKLNVGFADPDWRFPDLIPIINEIRRERRIELALEGFRYDDLMRWAAGDLIQGMKLKGARFIPGVSFPDIEEEIMGIVTDDQRYIDRYHNSAPNGLRFDINRDYLYPLPVNELTQNNNLTQNPGW